MSMTKKDFIALANAIKEHNAKVGCDADYSFFSDNQLQTIADFCGGTNPNFNRDRWFGYIRGECGSNGGKVKAVKS